MINGGTGDHWGNKRELKYDKPLAVAGTAKASPRACGIALRRRAENNHHHRAGATSARSWLDSK